MFTPSLEQKRIIKYVEENITKDSPNNIVISAFAGSGKTFTLGLITNKLLTRQSNPLQPQQILCCAFTNKNQTDIKNKFQDIDNELTNSVLNYHKLGRKIISLAITSNIYVDTDKYINIAKQLGYLPNNNGLVNKELDITKAIGSEVNNKFIRLIDMVRNDYLPLLGDRVDLFINSCQQLGIELLDYQLVWNAIIHIIRTGIDTVLSHDNTYDYSEIVIDFTDMLYLPVYCVRELSDLRFIKAISGDKNNVIPIRKLGIRKEIKVIMLDETQDLNLISLLLMDLIKDHTNFFIFVGDDRQNIYGWRGSIDNCLMYLKTTKQCEEFKLTTTYRLPSGHVQLVNNIFDYMGISLKQHKTNYGHYELIDYEQMYMNLMTHITSLINHNQSSNKDISNITDNTSSNIDNTSIVVLGRYNKNIYNTAITLMSKGIPVSIKGKRSIIPYIVNLINDILGGAEYNRDTFLSLINDYEERLIISSTESYSDIDKKVQTIRQLYNSYYNKATTLDNWILAMKEVELNTNNVVLLHTFHSYKGGESDIVYVLDVDSLPIEDDKHTPRQRQEEWNALYIALTRSKDVMYLVSALDIESQKLWLRRNIDPLYNWCKIPSISMPF